MSAASPGGDPPQKHPRTAWSYIRAGLVRAHTRRPISFYLLLAMPVALMAAAGLLDRENLRQFFGVLGLLIVFFGVVMIRAIGDIFDIARQHLREQRRHFRETLGEPTFAESLGERVKQAQEQQQQ